ncbi:MAG: histidine kinase dimerization/phospho-acceptor domain-containing protein, partial [Flavobacteriales bacterium]
MTIRNRLVIQFLVLASFILGLAFVAVYLRSADFRQDQFRNRLRERGEVTVNLLIDVEEVDDRLLRRIDANNPLRVPEESITIFSDDSILFHLGEDHGDDPVELLPLSKEDGTVAGEVGEREVLGYKVNTGKGPVMVISSGYDRYGRTKLSDLRRMMVITFLLGMGLIVILGRVFASQALAPVKNLIREIQHIRAAGLSARVDTGNGKDELAQLANAFNLLLKRLETVFKLQKDFIANASHEMHTPLTAISGQIDVVLLKPRSVPEYAETLRSVQDDLRAVNRLSLRLLLLARAEAETLSSQFVPVRVDELIWAARTEVLRNGA